MKSRPTYPLRILASQAAIPELELKLQHSIEFPYQLLSNDQISIGDSFDVALISRDVTSLSTKQKIIPSTQNFYDLLLGSKDLRWVQIHSAGADRQIYLDLMKRGIQITGSSGVNAQVVIQTAIAGILMLARHFPQMLEAQRQRRWDSLIKYPLPADLVGQTAIIVGRGPIGNGIAQVLTLMGVHCIQIRFNPDSGGNVLSGAESRHISELNSLLGLADWLVLACPLSADTRQLIDADAIDLLPRSARIVNIARGEIICEESLINALQSKRIAGAYLDVFASEPLDTNSALWDLENVIVTPHSAGHSAGNESRVLDLFVENLNLLNEGKPLKNTILAPASFG
jgi:phosphoglycerate dehydrogenase-like enzyme